MTDTPNNARTERAAGRRSLLRQAPLFLVAVVLWLLLWGDLSPMTIATGVLLAALLPRVFFLPPVEVSARFNPWWAARFAAVMVYDIVTASLKVAWQSVNWTYHPVNAVIEVRLRTASDLIMSLTAEAISLIPGTSVIETDRETMSLFLHVLGAETPAKIADARAEALRLESRIILAIGSRDEAALIRSASSQAEAQS